jgi:hypothetical protein
MWDHALAIKPDDADTKVARAFLELDWKADTRPLIPQHGQLKLLPCWDPLRRDLRFEKIVASLAPKETVSR